MKLLYLTHQFFPHHVGGTETYLKELAHQAQRVGHQVKVVTCCESSASHPDQFNVIETEFEGIPLTEVHFNLGASKHPATSEYCNPYTEKVVTDVIHSFKPDRAHVLHAMKLSGSVLEALTNCCIPFIITLCDFWFICPRHTLLKWDGSPCNGQKYPLSCMRCVKDLHQFKPTPSNLLAYAKRNRYLMKHLLQAKKIIALSPFQKKMFVANGYPAERIEVIAHGLDLSQLRTKSNSGTLKTIGFIGNLVEFKGAHILVEAFLRNPSMDLNCLLFGPIDRNKPYVKELLHKAESDPRIRFCGGFQADQINTIYEQFDCLALPALWYENEPLVVKAAHHIGMPVMASHIGSLPDMITDGVNGWLVPPGDVDAWSKRLQSIATKPILQFLPPKIKSIEENAEEVLSLLKLRN